ncbi:hypothetical protein [Psychrobium sp. 1_MG-2023]|uniref:hypothetical protein n=1 Tax=Psychrobium sp. 1_MG-2023 TaxID=3062624 RepID=UPI000C3230A7|nr:hypothetical protein [Psychrobium sp. 1_MG-2023]MDP2562673.1 hypothetical protein [Psychrobium sp. 1_MG-2023]PKF53796.1 hypothetical protein CW748_17490 [Alteromonadales bacterium alter-6D02]
MSNLSLNLLIDAGLITSSGKVVDLKKLPANEISNRLSQYNRGRIETAESEISNHESTDKLSALFSTGSTSKNTASILSSSLVYDSIVIDDPIVTSSNEISFDRLVRGLKLFEWGYELIRANFLKVLPISFFNKPSNDIPLLLSDDAFKSCIPPKIHDFIHENATLKSVVRSDKGEMLILSEDAYKNRRTALNVEFINDYWKSGVSLYLFETLENCIEDESGGFACQKIWNPEGKLEKERFNTWAYQAINQAIRCRLNNIYNETFLAERLGHTYITESSFEAKFMSMSGDTTCSTGSISAKFLKANNSFINIDSPNTILELRNKHSEAFERFNFSLQSISEELSGVDPELFDRKAENLFHKEILPQVDEIRDNVNLISSSGVKGALGSLVGLSAAIATGSSLPLIASIMNTVSSGVTEAFPAISQQQRFQKRPAYIWHRVTKTY